MDLTHFSYVHAKTFGISDWTSPPKVEVKGDVVTYIQEFRQSPLAPVYAGAIGVEVGKPFNRDNRGSFISPALQVASVDFEDPNPTPGARTTFRLRICHATTPIDARHMHYFWSFGRDHGTSPDMMERLHAAKQWTGYPFPMHARKFASVATQRPFKRGAPWLAGWHGSLSWLR